MRKAIFLMTFILLWCLTAAAQHAIRANRVAKHIGEKMTVVDSISDVKSHNGYVDISLGKENSKPLLEVILKLNPNFKLDEGDLKKLNESLLEVTGNVVLVGEQPTIYITNKEDLFFFASTVNQKWQVLSQLQDKKK
jgi:hypothetical protein